MQNPDAYQNHRLPNTPANQFMGHRIVSDQVSRDDLATICRELEQVLRAGVSGDIVEFGCYGDTTSLFIRRLLDKWQRAASGAAPLRLSDPRESSEVQPGSALASPGDDPRVTLPSGGQLQTGASTRQFHVYDSFEGLPPKTSQDISPAGEQFQAGRLAVSKKDFLREFKLANLRPPIVHKGWFDQLTDADVPKHIAFAFLDGDFYDSILTSLKLVWPRMDPHGVILVDDYKREALPGAERAIHDFFQGKSVQSIRGEHNIAIIKL
jgi:O-methyltransferase